MKFFVVSRDGKSAQGGADSAVLRHGEPVFLPMEGHWRSIVAPAVRISRLGLHIPLQRAASHYDSITAVHLLIPDDATALPVPSLFCDRALAPGSSMPVPPADDAVLEVTYADRRGRIAQQAYQMNLTALAEVMDKALSQISEWVTLKTGDLIVAAMYAVELPEPQPDTYVRAYVNQNLLLDIKLK